MTYNFEPCWNVWVALSITDYVRKTLDDFVKKYHGEFRIPVVLPPSSEAPSLTKMLVMIIVSSSVFISMVGFTDWSISLTECYSAGQAETFNSR